VTQMLAGTVAIRDRYARQLLAGIGEQDYHKFNSYTATKRAQLVQKSFEQPSLMSAANAFGETFAGVTSTLKDNLEIALGKVGMPLFKAVTAEVKSWNEWMGANQEKLAEIGRTIGDGLVTGFKYAKSAAEFLVANAGTIMDIGKVWLMFRLAGGLGGTIGGALGGIGGAVGGFGGGKASGLESAIKKFGDRVGLYQSYGAGLAISSAGGMAGAAQSIGLGGALQIGVISHELGEYLGVHRAITNVIDPQRVKYEKLMVSIKQWDDALLASRDKLAGKTGAAGTSNYSNATTAAGLARIHAESMKDAYRMMKASPGGFWDPLGGAAGRHQARKHLEAGGLDPDTVDKFMKGSPSEQAAMMKEAAGRASMVQQSADRAAALTDQWVQQAIDKMSADERASLDMQAGTQRLFEVIHRMIASGTQPTLGPAYTDTISLLSVIGILKGAEDKLPQGKAPVTNIKIDRVEVAAKDPDRWIAELDAKARSHNRAPRQPRAAVRGGF